MVIQFVRLQVSGRQAVEERRCGKHVAICLHMQIGRGEVLLEQVTSLKYLAAELQKMQDMGRNQEPEETRARVRMVKAAFCKIKN